LGEGAYPRNGTSVDEQMTFPVGDGSSPPGGPQSLEELPLVYVVTALTALNKDEHKLVDGWSDTINRAVIEAGPAGNTGRRRARRPELLIPFSSARSDSGPDPDLPPLTPHARPSAPRSATCRAPRGPARPARQDGHRDG